MSKDLIGSPHDILPALGAGPRLKVYPQELSRGFSLSRLEAEGQLGARLLRLRTFSVGFWNTTVRD